MILYFLPVGFLGTLTVWSQTEVNKDQFLVSDNAKLICKWNGISNSDVSVEMTCGDQITILNRQMLVYVIAKHGNLRENVTIIGELDKMSELIIEVYEYDFDADGINEILVINSEGPSIVNIEVFRYSNGLSRRVGNLFGQYYIILENNRIGLPYGGQGLSKEYLYLDGSFFELKFHDPDSEE